MRLMFLSLLSGCMAWAASPYPNIDATQQKTGVSNPKDAAVVIGIEDYFSLPDVPGAAADAQLVRDTFVYTLGMDPSRVSLLVRVGGQGRASRSGIQQAIEARARLVQGGGRLWVYFAGHGSAAEGSNERILLSDQTEADKASFVDNSVSVSEIQAWGVAGGGQVVLVTDACFNGTGRDGSLQTGTRYAVPVSEIQKAQLTQWHATSATEVAQPLLGTGHGAFTYFWVGALRGWADGQFGSVDGVVTAGEVQEYVSKALGASQIIGETPQFGGDGAWEVSQGQERGPDLSGVSSVTGQGQEKVPGKIEVMGGGSANTWTAADAEVLSSMVRAKREELLGAAQTEQEAERDQLIQERQAAVAAEWATLRQAFGSPKDASLTSVAAVGQKREEWAKDTVTVATRRVTLDEVVTWKGKEERLSGIEELVGETLQVDHHTTLQEVDAWLSAASVEISVEIEAPKQKTSRPIAPWLVAGAGAVASAGFLWGGWSVEQGMNAGQSSASLEAQQSQANLFYALGYGSLAAGTTSGLIGLVVSPLSGGAQVGWRVAW